MHALVVLNEHLKLLDELLLEDFYFVSAAGCVMPCSQVSSLELQSPDKDVKFC